MIDNTYLLWDVKVNEALVRVMAWTEEDALEKAARILPGPGRSYSVAAVVEYWMPGVQIENMVRVMEKAHEKEGG